MIRIGHPVTHLQRNLKTETSLPEEQQSELPSPSPEPEPYEPEIPQVTLPAILDEMADLLGVFNFLKYLNKPARVLVASVVIFQSFPQAKELLFEVRTAFIQGPP